jgi:hypothetical protein
MTKENKKNIPDSAKFLSKDTWSSLIVCEVAFREDPYDMQHNSELSYALDSFIFKVDTTDGLASGSLFVETCILMDLPWVAARGMCLAFTNAFENLKDPSMDVGLGMIWSTIRKLYNFFITKELFAQYGFVLSYSAKNWCKHLTNKINEYRESTNAYKEAKYYWEASEELEELARLYEQDKSFDFAADAFIEAVDQVLLTILPGRFERAQYLIHAARSAANTGSEYKIAGHTIMIEKRIERQILLQFIKTSKLKNSIHAILALIESLILFLICGHFERPLRVLITAGIVILVCAILYMPEIGISTLNGIRTEELPIMESFITAFHFSAITFATVGYGNINPKNDAAMLITSAEGLLGLLLGGLFLFCLGRKSGTR